MAAVAILLCAGWLTACQSEAPRVDEGAAVEDVEEDPEDYIGQSVTLEGEINDLHEANAFTIEGDELDVFDDEILVIVPATADVTEPDTAAAMQFNEDDEIQVEGTVRRYVGLEMQDEFDLDPTWGVNYEQEPVLIADRVQIIDRDDAAATDGAEAMDDAMSSANQ